MTGGVIDLRKYCTKVAGDLLPSKLYYLFVGHFSAKVDSLSTPRNVYTALCSLRCNY